MQVLWIDIRFCCVYMGLIEADAQTPYKGLSMREDCALCIVKVTERCYDETP